LDKAELVARLQAAQLEKKKTDQALADQKAQEGIKEAEAAVKIKQAELKAAGGDDAAAKQALAVAQHDLEIARAEAQATSERLAFSDWSHSQADVQVAMVGIAKSTITYGSQNNSPELADLQKKLSELQARVDQLEVERRNAVEKALTAERKVRQLLRDPVGSSRPTRTTRRSDLWWIQTDEEPEATELP
jgi:hypothetical protein